LFAKGTVHLIENRIIKRRKINMKKVFISVGMRGRCDADVVRDLNRAKHIIYTMFGTDIEIVDNWSCEGPEDAGRLWYLGEAIKKLGDCDACYFTKGWQKHKGCVAEMEICRLYGIEMIEES
jgi:hypothetical protein